MQLHNLKIKYEYLVAVTAGIKTFELRKNDRNYQVGDLIQFTVIDRPTTKFKGITPTLNDLSLAIYSETLYRITYILENVPEYGLDKDYCILGIKKLEIKEDN